MMNVEELLRFDRDRGLGLYAGCKYPNLIEICDYFPISYFADVTDELMLAVFESKEDLTAEELSKIARYCNIPLSVLTCPKLITLNRRSRRHWQMMQVLRDKLYEIWDLEKRGSKHADEYMHKYANIGRIDFVNMELDFRNGKEITYGHYLGVKHKMDDTICFARGEFRPKPRGLKEGVAV